MIKLFSAMLMMFGIFFGLSLTAGSGLFYNILIMPVVGALGYCMFRQKAIYAVPTLMLVTHLVTNLLSMGFRYCNNTHQHFVRTAVAFQFFHGIHGMFCLWFFHLLHKWHEFSFRVRWF